MAEVKSSVNISIGADVENFKRAMEEAQKRATSFERNLVKAAAATAAAYGAIKVAVVNSLSAFAEQEKIGNQLTQALITQGIYTDKLRQKYDDLAAQTSRVIGIDDDLVKAAFAQAQAYLGNIEITDRLTKAASDLAVATGISLDEAFVKIAKSVTTNTNALAKNGIEVNQAVSDNERLNGILGQIEARWGGQAQASGGVAVAFSNLKNAAGDLYEEIGAQLAPAAVMLAKALTAVIDSVRENQTLVKFVTIIGTVAAAVLAAISGVSALVAGFQAFIALIAPVTGLLTSVAAAVVGAFSAAPIAVGAMVAAVVGGITAIILKGETFMGILEKIKSGIASVFGGGESDAKGPDTSALSAAQEKQLEENKKAQAKIEAERLAHNQRLALIEKNQARVSLLTFQEGSKRLIELKTQENAILKQLDETRNEKVRTALNTALAENRAQQELESQERIARIQEFAAIESQAKAEAMQLGFDIETELTLAQKNKLLELEQTETEAKRQVYEEQIRQRVEANNRFLQDQARYSTTFATINAAINSDWVKGVKEAADQLVALSQSRNKTLASIGKAAAVTQIGIDTAQGAAAIFAKLNALFPVAAPFVGAAGAASIVAFGAERTADVLAANRGGVVPGVGNTDSVPAMLTPGEIVIPKPLAPTFEQQFGSGGGMGEVVSQLQALRGEISAVRPNSVVVNGDIMTDDSFIDRLISKISDRLEFGNARLAGVNA